MGIIVYNKAHEEHIGDNVFYIGRGSLFGNPFTHIKNKETKAEAIVESREKTLECYKEYFNMMYNSKDWFKEAVDKIYELYKNGTDVYLECYCAPLPCHGDIIKDFLISKLMKEKVEEILKTRRENMQKGKGGYYETDKK